MNPNFIILCTTIVVVVLLTAYGLFPLFRDAAGYVNEILNTVYHVEFSVVVP